MPNEQRTTLVFVWDLRAPMFEAENLAERWAGAIDYLDRLYPALSESRILRGYIRPDQIEVERELGGLGFATRRVYEGMETKIVKDIERLFDVEHRIMMKAYARDRLPRLEPPKTVFVLASNDGDYEEFLAELRRRGVAIHLIVTDRASERLMDAATDAETISWDSPSIRQGATQDE